MTRPVSSRLRALDELPRSTVRGCLRTAAARARK